MDDDCRLIEPFAGVAQLIHFFPAVESARRWERQRFSKWRFPAFGYRSLWAGAKFGRAFAPAIRNSAITARPIFTVETVANFLTQCFFAENS